VVTGDYKMNDKEFMDYVAEKLVSGLLGRIETEEDFGQAIIKDYVVDKDEPYEHARYKLPLTNFSQFKDVAWVAAYEVEMPGNCREVAQTFESTGELPKPNIKHERSLSLYEGPAAAFFDVNDVLTRVEGREFAYAPGWKEGQTLDEALNVLLNHVSAFYQGFK